ncbi:MAG: 6-carboxytetrahydropterin synthase [Planctomycetota bacterium]|nr:6-carboxytetrahydropterin synthase [Planctomycetota bacterium]
MYKLGRAVRFSIAPFLQRDADGFNSFASKPAGEGLSIFFELLVEVVGKVEPTTGFVVNVTDIDRIVRKFVVPVFAQRIRTDFRRGRHIGFFDIAKLLKAAWQLLSDKFDRARLSNLSLKLNPFRKVTMDSKDLQMLYFSEKFEFAATHKLWNDDFSEQRNFEIFGKCANPTGHGHIYIVEVTIKMPAGKNNFRIGGFEKVVDDELIKVVDHKNLNTDVAAFGKTNPTVENIAAFAWNKLVGKFDKASLHCITVWETDKTFSSYYG